MVRAVIGALLVVAVGCASEQPETASRGGSDGDPGASGAGGSAASEGAGAAGGWGGSGGDVGAGGIGGGGGQNVQVGCAERSDAVGIFATPVEWANDESAWCLLPSVADEHGCSFFEARAPEAWREDLQWVDCGVGCQKLDLAASSLGEPAKDALSNHYYDGVEATYFRVSHGVRDVAGWVGGISRTIHLESGRVLAASKMASVGGTDASGCAIAMRKALALQELVLGGSSATNSTQYGWSTVLPGAGQRIWRPMQADRRLASWDAFDTDDGTVLLPAGGGLRALPVEGEELVIKSEGGFISGAGAGERAWWLAYVGSTSSLWSWEPGGTAQKHLDFEKPTCDLDATPNTVSGWSSSGGCVESELSDLYFWTASAAEPGITRRSNPIALPEGIRVFAFATSDNYAAAMINNSVGPFNARVWVINLRDFSIREIVTDPETLRVRLTMTSRYVYAGDMARRAADTISTLYRYDLEHIDYWSVPLP